MPEQSAKHNKPRRSQPRPAAGRRPAPGEPEGLDDAHSLQYYQYELGRAECIRLPHGAIDDDTLRLRLEIHLELCAACRQGLAAVTQIHPSEEELIDYHDHQMDNPRTLARVQAHVEAQQCQSCQSWLEELHQEETMAAQWSATQPPAPADVPQRVTLGQRLQAVGGQLTEALITLDIFGAREPQLATYTTAHAPVYGSADGLEVRVREASDGGQEVTLSSEQEEHAGSLFALVHTALDTQLLQSFCVLPTTPDEADYFESALHVPGTDMAAWTTPVRLQVRLRDPETLQEQDVPALQWSFLHAADTISQDAWHAFFQGLQENTTVPQAVRDWCASLRA